MDKEDINPKYLTREEFFGEKFDGLKGKDAVNKLLEEKRGHVPNAFYRDDIGCITLAWGNSEAGLKHIIEQRKKQNINPKDILNNLADVVENGNLKFENDGKYKIWKNGIKVSITPTFRDDKLNWIITAFKQSRE
jgi:hypothetical protein